jgi:NAD(P)-dependent dehydrogenase (short-subunit alcohol dehydrogenase family)
MEHHMDTDLTGTTAIVTGASRGIGLAVVEALVARGARVVGGARTISAELEALTPFTLAVDLATAGGPERLVAHALHQAGPVDLLVNNVGGNPAPFTGFLSVEDRHWQQAVDLNLLSTVRATRAALPGLIEQRGAIVNIASTSARLAQPSVVAYAAAKAAMLSLGKALADEFGPLGVRVNTISPGPVLTPLWSGPESAGAAMAGAMGITQEELLRTVPDTAGMTTKAMVSPSEVAALVVLLASGTVPSMRGAELVVDGGLLKAL